MRHYIFIKRMQKLPKRGDAIAYCYDETFRNDEYAGGYCHIDNREYPDLFQLSWPKWKDNPDISNDDVLFTCIRLSLVNPYTKIFLLGCSKEAVRLTQEKKFQYLGRATLGGEIIVHNPALVDVIAYHKMVFYFSEKLDALIWDTKSKKMTSVADYYKKYKYYINHKFSRKLTAHLLQR